MPPLPCCWTTTARRSVGRSEPTTRREVEPWFSRVVDRLLIPVWVLSLRSYRVLLSPLFAGSCRFEPSCSHYAEDAVQRHGMMRGCWLTLCRLARCQPWHAGGYDPVPAGGRRTLTRGA